MEKDMNYKLISTFFSEKEDRKAEVFKDTYHYGVNMYERESNEWGSSRWIHVRTELLENHNVQYAEDLAENYVQRWGAFKDVE